MSTIETLSRIGTEVPGTWPGGDLAFLGPVRQVHVNGTTIGYRHFGAGPPIVLVLGQGSTMAMWGTELPRRLAAHHEVLMYDLRGVGHSRDPAATPLTIGQMADDLAALLDVLGIARPTVVGWSTGGEIALSLATTHPDSVAALVLSGATPGGPPTVHPDHAADEAFRSGDLERLLDLSFTPAGNTRRAAYVQEVLDLAGVSTDDTLVFPESMDRRQDHAERVFATDSSVYDALHRIHVPTLVTNGAEDRLVPVANAERIADRIPNARLHIYRDSAHVMWFQHLDRFIGDVEQVARAA
jgi:pimeloyl-ACP methyl ester carboxylesterase